jgi:ubiquitin carboxyl-terminal hydrolase 7
MEETTRNDAGEPIWLDAQPSVPSSPAINGSVPQQPQKPIIIFLKYFDIERQTLQGMGHIYMDTMDKVQDLAPQILQLMGWEPGVSLELYEEIKQNYVEQMKPKQTLHASEIQDGDIICFQRHLSESEAAAIRQTKPAAQLNAKDFYDFLVNRILVNFTPKVAPPPELQVKTEGDERFALYLSKKDTYETLATKVAEYLSSVSEAAVDLSFLRFTTVTQTSGKPRTIIKPQPALTVQNILLGGSGYGYGYQPAQAPDQLYYEVLEMSLKDLEQRKTVKINWLSSGITQEVAYDILVPKQSTFTEVREQLQKRAQLPDEIMGQIRFYEVHSGKVYKVLPLSHSVVALNEFLTIYAERVPEEEQQLDLDSGDRAIWCFHFEKEPSKHHSIPFIFVIKEGEIFKETKERLSKRTGIKGKNFEKVRFAVVKGGQNYSRPVWVEDGMYILDAHGTKSTIYESKMLT